MLRNDSRGILSDAQNQSNLSATARKEQGMILAIDPVEKKKSRR
jgi:hypothetical protein